MAANTRFIQINVPLTPPDMSLSTFSVCSKPPRNVLTQLWVARTLPCCCIGMHWCGGHRLGMSTRWCMPTGGCIDVGTCWGLRVLSCCRVALAHWHVACTASRHRFGVLAWEGIGMSAYVGGCERTSPQLMPKLEQLTHLLLLGQTVPAQAGLWLIWIS